MEAFLLDVYPVEEGINTHWTTYQGKTYQAVLPNLYTKLYKYPFASTNLIELIKQLQYLEHEDQYKCIIKAVQKHGITIKRISLLEISLFFSI